MNPPKKTDKREKYLGLFGGISPPAVRPYPTKAQPAAAESDMEYLIRIRTAAIFVPERNN